mgnify:CR=1 FL=1
MVLLSFLCFAVACINFFSTQYVHTHKLSPRVFTHSLTLFIYINIRRDSCVSFLQSVTHTKRLIELMVKGELKGIEIYLSLRSFTLYTLIYSLSICYRYCIYCIRYIDICIY